MSYDGELVSGVNADHAATPNLDVIETALYDEFVAVARPNLSLIVDHQAPGRGRNRIRRILRADAHSGR